MTEEKTRQYQDIVVRVTMQDGKAVSMEIRTSTPFWNVRADMILDGIDEERALAWLYGQVDQVLAEFRRLLRRGHFCQGNESEAGNDL